MADKNERGMRRWRASNIKGEATSHSSICSEFFFVKFKVQSFCFLSRFIATYLLSLQLEGGNRENKYARLQFSSALLSGRLATWFSGAFNVSFVSLAAFNWFVMVRGSVMFDCLFKGLLPCTFPLLKYDAMGNDDCHIRTANEERIAQVNGCR